MGPVRQMRRFTSDDVRAWERIDGGIQLGAAVDADYGRLSAGFARMAVGARAPLAAPYEEVWIIMAGTMTIDGADDVVAARPGDLIHLNPATRGEFRIDDDLEMVALAYPPAWDIDRGAWESAVARSTEGPAATVFSAEHAAAGRHHRVGQESLVPAVADRPAEPRLGIGFRRTPAAASIEFRVPRDSVIVAVEGQFTIHVDHRASEHRAAADRGAYLAVRRGQFVYLPAGTGGTLVTDSGSAIAWAHLRHSTAEPPA
ncbi:hypothetical protein [Nocardia cyriacigeorgica]|uniref:hypothetical protein n=1 Tax=Nocardia cyriacigeorgica TaxID=135487 RepID=UPI00245625C9|nr:hypothetical protein [Nocardia cyriacigeorgica]